MWYNVYLQIGVSRAMSALRPFTMEEVLRNVPPVGMNPGKRITSKVCTEMCNNVHFWYRSWFIYYSAWKEEISEFLKIWETSIAKETDGEKFPNQDDRGLYDNRGSETTVCLDRLKKTDPQWDLYFIRDVNCLLQMYKHRHVHNVISLHFNMSE